MSQTPPPDTGTGRYRVSDRVLVARDPGLPPAVAVIVADNDRRPHLVKVIYVRSRRGAWIARTRILGPAHAPDSDPAAGAE